jgi:putative ABC transport system permease protein
MTWTAFLIALQAIRRHMLRSILTVLGVVIGVWSVVTMVTLGNATTQAVTASITSLGSETLTLAQGRGFGRGGGGGAARSFSFDDVEAIKDQVGGVRLAVPSVTTSRTVVLNAANWQTTITGTTRDYLTVQQWDVVEGRAFDEEEDEAGRAVCLLGHAVRDRLLADQPADGQVLRVGDISCTVVGVLAERGQGFGNNPDDSIVMPIKAVQRRLAGNRDVSSILISYDPQISGDQVKADLSTLMRQRRLIGPESDDDFNIFDARQIADTVSTTTTLLTALLAAVGAVSLIVGGIGIMNIMLVSVTERTREIGIRLAVGALGRDVLRQFLVEAVVLSCIGGLIGLVLASLTTLLVAPLLGVPVIFEPAINLIAFLLSATIGIAFGYLPAHRAASLNPIEALRHE